MENLIEIEHLFYGYQERPVLEDISLSSHRGTSPC